MRGTFFQKPLELKIEINGESWIQGDKISGELNIVDHSGQNDLSKCGVAFAIIDLKKFKDKKDGAVTVLDKVINVNSPQVNFNFSVAKNSQITEKNITPSLLVGNLDDLLSCSVMQLNIGVHKSISDYVNLIEMFYRFKLKGLKSKKGEIELTLTAPSSKDWSQVEKFIVLASVSDEGISLKHQAVVKKISFENMQTTTKEVKVSFDAVVSKKEMYSFEESINQDLFKNIFEQMLDKIKLKPVI